MSPMGRADRRLVVAAPLAIEARAVRQGLVGGVVVRAGLRARRVGRVAGALREHDPSALAVVGVAGALVPGYRAGDLVVATEVRSAAGVVPCPSAGPLAEVLRHRGLRVHTAPLVTVDHVVHGAERARLAQGGAVVVDMESAALLGTAGGRPSVVVRAVVDTPERPLLRPATLPGGVAALRSLNAVGPALAAWAAAAPGADPIERPRGGGTTPFVNYTPPWEVGRT
jgi:4-hydroxy-3-methylbut-2-enyl diphosphate reductase